MTYIHILQCLFMCMRTHLLLHVHQRLGGVFYHRCRAWDVSMLFADMYLHPHNNILRTLVYAVITHTPARIHFHTYVYTQISRILGVSPLKHMHLYVHIIYITQMCIFTTTYPHVIERYSHVHIDIYTHIHTNSYIHTYTRTLTYIHTYTRTHMCISTYIHTYTRTQRTRM